LQGRIPGVLVLLLCVLLLTTTACNTTPSGDTAEVTIAAIIDTPSEFEGEVVIVSGEYRGWQAENGYEPPVTRSDWVIKDDTGWIYVTGKASQLDPVADIGTPTVVQGKVRVTEKGIPYLEAESVNVKE
jgi:hypothetical protein